MNPGQSVHLVKTLWWMCCTPRLTRWRPHHDRFFFGSQMWQEPTILHVYLIHPARWIIILLILMWVLIGIFRRSKKHCVRMRLHIWSCCYKVSFNGPCVINSNLCIGDCSGYVCPTWEPPSKNFTRFQDVNVTWFFGNIQDTRLQTSSFDSDGISIFHHCGMINQNLWEVHDSFNFCFVHNHLDGCHRYMLACLSDWVIHKDIRPQTMVVINNVSKIFSKIVGLNENTLRRECQCHHIIARANVRKWNCFIDCFGQNGLCFSRDPWHGSIRDPPLRGPTGTPLDGSNRNTFVIVCPDLNPENTARQANVIL